MRGIPDARRTPHVDPSHTSSSAPTLGDHVDVFRGVTAREEIEETELPGKVARVVKVGAASRHAFASLGRPALVPFA